MRPIRLIAALPLLLAAAPAPPLMPGAWEETLVFTLDTVNGSAEQARRMAGTLPAREPTRSCITMSDLLAPERLFLAGAEQSCRFSRFAMADGTIEAAGDCSDGHGRTMHVEGSGRYTSTAYDLDFTGTGASGGLALAFQGRDSGRRIGTCTAF